MQRPRQLIPVRAGQPPRVEPRYRKGRFQSCPHVQDFAPCQLRDLVLIEWPGAPKTVQTRFGLASRDVLSSRIVAITPSGSR